MTKKPIKFYALALLAVLLCSGLLACGTTDSGNQGGSGDSVIKAVTAKETSVELKVGKSVSLKSLYEVEGYSKLSSAQKGCTYESSDEDVVKINKDKAEAIAPGTATITITSEKDTTKSCEIEIKVSKVFFNYDLTSPGSADDMSGEWNEATQTGKIRTLSAVEDKTINESSNYYYAADIYSTKWYIETYITINDYLPNDGYPKVGIITSSKTSAYDTTETMTAFFFSLTPDLGTSAWNEFGVAEVAKGGHWAWEKGYTNSMARHHDFCWNSNNFYGKGGKFKLAVARDGLDFHVYIEGNYVGSHKLNSNMDILVSNGQPVASHVGFYYFSVDATFSDYKVTADATEVAKYCPATPAYIHTSSWVNWSDAKNRCDASGYLIDANDNQ